ncbi:MAG TPA: hypothetical protein VD969_06090 [Symbiobacteriaceae bacterium]|nr:hypothetical protein [Symbiobacteriaceae bacterium]
MDLPLTILRPAACELPLEKQEVLRLLGYKPGVTRMDGRHDALVDRGIALAAEAAAPVASIGYCGIIVRAGEVLTRMPGVIWRSRALARLLRGGVGVSLVAATLGPGIDELTARLFAGEEYALATVVDAAGSALVQGLGRCVSAYLREQIQGLTLTPLYGPGYGDWDIHDQLGLVQAAGGPAIGLTNTAACYLQPRKSLVGIVGWIVPAEGRRVPTTGCDLCTMKECAYRHRAPAHDHKEDVQR